MHKEQQGIEVTFSWLISMTAAAALLIAVWAAAFLAGHPLGKHRHAEITASSLVCTAIVGGILGAAGAIMLFTPTIPTFAVSTIIGALTAVVGFSYGRIAS